MIKENKIDMSDKKYKNPDFIISKVYTKTGDKGKTSLVGGQKISKSNIRIESYGEVDELNAIIGICIEEIKLLQNKGAFNNLVNSLIKIQNDLFNLGTILATLPEDMNSKMPQVTMDDIKILENKIDEANHDLSVLHSFVLPGGSKINAYFHLARTVCRRTERICCRLYEEEKVDQIVISYLNRLSDAFFVWSRWASMTLNHKENIWDPNKGSSNK